MQINLVFRKGIACLFEESKVFHAKLYQEYRSSFEMKIAVHYERRHFGIS